MNAATLILPATPLPAPNLPIVPSAAVVPQPYRWTNAEYRELYKTGLFSGRKTMLLDGLLYVSPQHKPPHDTAMGLAAEALRAVFPTCHHVRNQQAFEIGKHNNPGPDLAVVPGSIRDYASKTPTTAVMVVEVSDSTLFLDTTTKAELYATAGVPEYWVIDLNNRQLLVYRDPVALPVGLGATAYRTHLAFGPADKVAPLAAPQASVRVADLLP